MIGQQTLKRIILLDGAKGAGKSTVSDILSTRLQETAFLSIDKERRSLINQQRSRTELNKEAFKIILEKTKVLLEENTSVVIDCGLTEERVSVIDNIANNEDAKVYKFFLKAPYDILLERVRGRNKSKGNTTDENRFEEVFHILHAKDFSEFKIIETNTATPEEIANEIISSLV